MGEDRTGECEQGWQRDQQNWIRHPECEIYIGEQEHEGATLDEF